MRTKEKETNFNEKLINCQVKNSSLLCVGLDTLPFNTAPFRGITSNPVYEFNKFVVESTHDLVCAYKFQKACYSFCWGEEVLEKSIEFIQSKYPEIPIILDAKYNDIPNTSTLYAREAFDRYEVDAVTVNPFMGTDSIFPFLARTNKGVIVLCKTSNQGANDFQNQLCLDIAVKAQNEWRKINQNVSLVVGANCLREMHLIRKIAPDTAFLVPGIGHQNGDLDGVIENGIDKFNRGLIINSSRSIINSSIEEIRKKALDLLSKINYSLDVHKS